MSHYKRITTDNNEIGAIYPCYKEPKAFLNSILSYRRNYPDGDLVVFSDGGYNYAPIVKKLNGIYNTYPSLGDNNRLRFDLPQAEEFLYRLFDAIKLINQKYFVLLEDDVVIYDKISKNILISSADIVGCNRHNKELKCNGKNFYFGGCGGSLFRTEFFKSIKKENINFLIQSHWKENNDVYIDRILSYITYKLGGRIIGPVDELGECSINDWNSLVNNGTIKILHQAKWNYNKKLSDQEIKIILECDDATKFYKEILIDNANKHDDRTLRKIR